MLDEINIYVEGKTDQYFLFYILKLLSSELICVSKKKDIFLESNKQIIRLIDVTGVSKIIQKKTVLIKNTEIDDIVNFIMFDADIKNDKTTTKASYLAEFTNWKMQNIIQDYFFIENNLENFLLKFCLNDEYKECFTKYEECLKEQGRKNKLFDKSRFYAYLDSSMDISAKNKHNIKIDLKFDWSNYFDIEKIKNTDFYSFLTKII